MLRRNFKRTESIVRYWTERSLVLCQKIDNDAPSEQLPETEENLRRMQRARRIAVIGEKGSGKSSLLAGLINEPCIAAFTSESPYVRWRLLNDDGNAENSRFIDNYQLDGIELLDTAECKTEADKQALIPLLNESDLVIAVMGGDNPWCADTWKLLSSVSPESRALRLIVLTHCDRRPPDDILAIKKQIRDLSVKHLQHELPLYQLTLGGKIQGSGLDVFCERVQDALDSPELLRYDLKELYTSAVRLLDEQAGILRRRDQMLRTDSGFLSGIDREIDIFQHSQSESIPTQVQSMGNIVQSLVPQLANIVMHCLGFFVTPNKMIRLERLGEKLDNLYYDMVRKEVEKRQEAQDRTFIYACRENWDLIRPRMKQKLESDIGEFPESTLSADLKALRKELGHAVYAPLNKLGIKPFLVKICNAQIAWMTRIVYLSLIFIIMAGVLGGLGHNRLGLASLTACAMVWLIGSAILAWEKARIHRRIEEFTEPLQILVTESLQPGLRQLLVSRVSAYRKLFTEPRRKVARNIEQLSPLLEEHREIYRTLRSIGNYM